MIEKEAQMEETIFFICWAVSNGGNWCDVLVSENACVVLCSGVLMVYFEGRVMPI